MRIVPLAQEDGGAALVLSQRRTQHIKSLCAKPQKPITFLWGVAVVQHMLENGMDVCNCPKTDCERFGKCEECIAHHAAKGKLPFCKR